MSSTKALLYKFCVIVVFGFSVLLAEAKPISPTIDNGPRGNCTCGGFPAIVIDSESQPILFISPGLEVNCDDEGYSTCKQLCKALATATETKEPGMLCSRLKNAEELKVSAISTICDRSWLYADMTAEERFCCADSKVKVCSSVEKANITDVVDAKIVM